MIAAMARLLLTNGTEKRVLPLMDATVTIGRDPENSLTIEGADVSRRHCRIEPDGAGAWRVIDLGSKNGTLLNGKALTGPSPLRITDTLTVGDATLVVVSENDPALQAMVETPSLPMAVLEPGDSKIKKVLDGPQWPSITTDSDPWSFAATSEEDEGISSSSSIEQVLPPGVDRRTTRGFLKDRLLRLNLLSQAIASELDLDRLLDAILDAVLDFTGFERGLLLLVEEGGELKPVLGKNLDHVSLPADEQKLSSKVIELALRRKDATLVRDIPQDRTTAGFDPKTSWTSLGLRSALCLPLVAPMRGRPTARVSEDRRRAKVPTRLLGAIYLDSKKEVRPFDSKDRRLLRTVGAQAAIALQNARLHQQATTDPLTQLANRGFFGQTFDEELRRAHEEGIALAILMIDIDKFKSINDRYGHQVGDEVLKEVAKRIHDSIRRDDTAGRYGGEEFVVLLPGAGVDAAKTVALKIRMAIKETPMAREKVPVSASIGISIFPDHGRDAAGLIRRADQALYLAKHSGRDRAEIWRAALDRSGHRMDSLAGIVSGDAARDQRNLQVLLNTVGLARKPLGPEQYLESVLDSVLELTRGERALLFLGDDPERLELAGARGRAGTSLDRGGVQLSTSTIKTAAREKRPVCHLDAAEGDWSRGGPSSSIEQLRLKTVMCVPLVAADRALGALYVDDKAVRREFNNGDVAALEALANQLALTLAYDPRFQAKVADDVTTLRVELARLREENAKLRESQRVARPALPETDSLGKPSI
jgi:diguanylate cyclase (GGDEF)-like protein